MSGLIAWSLVLAACCVCGYRIVTNPATQHPVTSGVIVAALILAGFYLALDEWLDYSEDSRHNKRLMREMRRDLEEGGKQ